MVFRKCPVLVSATLFSEITRHNFVKVKEIIKIKKLLCFSFCSNTGHAVAQLVEALRYKLEGRGFDSQ